MLSSCKGFVSRERGLDAVLSLYRSRCVGKDRRSLIGAGCVEWPGGESRNEVRGEKARLEWVCGAGGTGVGKGSVWIVIGYESVSPVEVAMMVATVSCVRNLVQVFVAVANTLV